MGTSSTSTKPAPCWVRAGMSGPLRDGDRRVAVVTGGAGAIGGAIVARLAPDHTMVVLDRAGDVVVDLGDPDDVRRAAKLVLDPHGRCDIFVPKRTWRCTGRSHPTTPPPWWPCSPATKPKPLPARRSPLTAAWSRGEQGPARSPGQVPPGSPA